MIEIAAIARNFDAKAATAIVALCQSA